MMTSHRNRKKHEGLKKLAFLMLLLQLLAVLSLSALAEEGEQSAGAPIISEETDEDGNTVTVVDYGDGEGYSFRELPEYGDGDELLFSEEDAVQTEPSPADKTTEENTMKEESDRLDPQDGQAAPLPEGTPEPASGAGDKPITPVILGIAGTGVCALAAALLLKKRKTAGK